MKGILMSADMIQAAIEGRKTVTRRLDGLKEINQDPNNWNLEWVNSNTGIASFSRGDIVDGVIEITDAHAKARYHAGETVYIKEAYSTYGIPPNEVAYYKDEPNLDIKAIAWRSPVRMPEWAARHFIKILHVGAERLQGIIYDDCLDEGIIYPNWNVAPYNALSRQQYVEYVKDQFRQLWNSINPKYPWESNPWVFVYEFEFLKER